MFRVVRIEVRVPKRSHDDFQNIILQILGRRNSKEKMADATLMAEALRKHRQSVAMFPSERVDEVYLEVCRTLYLDPSTPFSLPSSRSEFSL